MRLWGRDESFLSAGAKLPLLRCKQPRRTDPLDCAGAWSKAQANPPNSKSLQLPLNAGFITSMRFAHLWQIRVRRYKQVG